MTSSVAIFAFMTARAFTAAELPFSWPIVNARKARRPSLTLFSPYGRVGDRAMTLEKARALACVGFFCLAAALGGFARAEQVYPGCAQPGPTGKVWYLDPVNGKTPADGGTGSQTAPWNSLPGILSFRFPGGYTRRCCRASPTSTSSTASASTLRTNSGARPSSPATRSC
jgi:hypothetical protein